MPIYAYRCASCGHQLDALQKISEPALVDCPACGAAALAKQVTAAGFQLKGSGWYQTDFRSGAKPESKEPAKDKGKEAGATATSDTAAAASEGAASATTGTASSASSPSAASPAGSGSGGSSR